MIGDKSPNVKNYSYNSLAGSDLSLEVLHHIVRQAQIVGLQDDIRPVDPFGVFQLTGVHPDFTVPLVHYSKTVSAMASAFSRADFIPVSTVRS